MTSLRPERNLRAEATFYEDQSGLGPHWRVDLVDRDTKATVASLSSTAALRLSRDLAREVAALGEDPG